MEESMTRRDFSKLAALAPATATAPGFASAYSPTSGDWRIEWPGRLDQHDVVYLSPPEDPSLGLPIGNGDLGALLWTTDSELVFAINKCDTWDDGPAGHYRDSEEVNTCLRHCGRLVIDFGAPVFDLIYLKDFEARLGLASAIAGLRSETPFLGVNAACYVSAGHRVMVVRSESNSPEPHAPRIRLERWGSRTFSRWYSTVRRDPSVGLGGTATSVEKGRIVIRQQLRNLSFVVAAQVEGAPPFRKLHGRAGAADLEPRERQAFTVYLTVVTSENDPDPAAAAHRLLDAAAAAGEPALRDAHAQEWRKFWSASFVDVPEKYLENTWHLALYFSNSSSRGASPPRFCNGLWGWNHDYSPWVSYFHWNMQDYVWPLHAANHAELAIPYLRYRRASLPKSIDYAATHFKLPGAFYGDVAERRGYVSSNQEIDNNRTPGAQIALDFWRHYAFTGDEKFLREWAWPVILEVTRFNAAMLVRGEDGLYHVSKTSAYEGSPVFDDTITDLAMIRGLFPVALEAGKRMGHDAAELAGWRERLEKLAPFRLVALEPAEYERRPDGGAVHRGGIGQGKKLESERVFLVGRDQKGQWLRNRYAGLKDKMPYYGLPDPELAPVFPGNVIGLGQRDSDLFRAAVAQVRLHPTADNTDESKPSSMEGRADHCMGWCPYPIVLARLGLTEELAAELVNTVSTWQFYPQGFGHYGPYYVFKPEQEKRWLLNHPNEAGKRGVKFPFPTWPFRHFDIEAMPIVACAMNEMLLQSHDGTLRVCPSVPETWTVRFSLAAQGGFLVSAEHADGGVRWIAITSRRGNPCTLERPWPGTVACIDMNAGAAIKLDERGGDLYFPTSAGRRYLLVRDVAEIKNWNTVPVAPERRREPRQLKGARLGWERLF